jgi:hypothetical protein
MGGLVEELQGDALNRSVPITDLLRKARAVAVRLDRPDFADWIEREMSGYEDAGQLPRYRKLSGEVRYRDPYQGWMPILGARCELPCVQPLSEIEALMSEREGSERAGSFVAPVPFAYLKSTCERLGFNADVKVHIAHSRLVGIIDAVRNTVLDWALKLEKAGVHGEGLSFSPHEKRAAQHIVIHNSGNIGLVGHADGAPNVASGDHSRVIAAGPVTGVADLKALLRDIRGHLDSSKLPSSLRTELKAELDELSAEVDGGSPEPEKVKGRLAKIGSGLATAGERLVAAGIEGFVKGMI